MFYKNSITYTTKDIYAIGLLVTGSALDYLTTVMFVSLPYVTESNPIVKALLQYPPAFLLTKVSIILFLLFIHYDATHKNPDRYVKQFFQITATSVGLLWLGIGLNNLYLIL